MQVGVVFPQTEIGVDAGAIREYARAVEDMGYTHILGYDHVLGANTASRPDWKGPYRLESTFHEPLMLFSHMAAVTSRIGFFTGILIAPQRQTVLVAKQAACLDVFCNGRLRLGVGTGWNEVEYEALGVPFKERGRILDEQVEVMRALWSEPAVTFDTPLHRITDAGINPLPVQRPIPLWFGGGSDRPLWNSPASEKVIRRIARTGDGWLPLWQPGERAEELLETFRGFCREYGRDPKTVGLEGTFHVRRDEEGNWADKIAAWEGIGASHLAVNTMGDGLAGAEQHLARLEQVSKLVR